MKKTVFMVASILIILAALVGFTACDNVAAPNPEVPNTEEPKPEEPKTEVPNTEEPKTEEPNSYVEMSTEYQTYYLNIAEADLGGLEGFHLKNLNTDKSVGIVIDKIFASNTMSEEDAVAVFNFDNPETGTNYWGFGAGTIADGTWSSGEIVAATEPADAPEKYITGFATSAFADCVYVGIVAKNLSAELKGDDISLIPIIGEPDPSKVITFRDFTTK